MKQVLIRTLEGTEDKKQFHSWVLWRRLRDKKQAVQTELQGSLHCPRDQCGGASSMQQPCNGVRLSIVNQQLKLVAVV